MSPAEADIAGIFLEEVASAADGRMAPPMSAAAIREGFHLDGCNILHPSWHAGETTYQADGEGLPCQQGGETHWRPKAHMARWMRLELEIRRAGCEWRST